MLIDFENILLTMPYMENHLSTFFFIPTKLIALPMKENLDKQGIEEEK